MKSDCDRAELTNGVREEVSVYCYARVALDETLGQTVQQETQRMVHRFESL